MRCSLEDPTGRLVGLSPYASKGPLNISTLFNNIMTTRVFVNNNIAPLIEVKNNNKKDLAQIVMTTVSNMRKYVSSVLPVVNAYHVTFLTTSV